MNNNQETVLAGLLSFAAALKVSFTATATNGSAVLTNVSVFTNLVNGAPLTGYGVPRGAFIQSFDAVAGTITASQKMTKDGAAQTFIAGFLTYGRRLPPEPPSQQPAFYIVHLESDDNWQNVRNVRSRIEAQIWIYVQTGADDVPSTLLNALVYMLKQAFAPDNRQTGTFTIGGLCSWCRIEGKSLYYPGDGAEQAVVILPVVITLP